ncbi:MAG: BamA/TamA family outer membrane protein [Bacteroidota bacterium]
MWITRGWAQEEKESIYALDSLGNTKNVRIIALPLAFYTPETNVGFGGGAQIFLLKQSNVYNARLSNIMLSGIYTLNEQLMVDIKPQIFFGGGDYYLDMAYRFKVFPNSFWGIGNTTPAINEESYDMTSNELRIAFLKRLPPALNFGFEFVYQNHNVTAIQEGGLLESEDILGSELAIISGLGVVFSLDNRDNIASPNSGQLLTLNARFSSENFGATSSFNKFIFDWRTYYSVGQKGVFAWQAYMESSYGEVPFQGQDWFGGGDYARGYFRGRFIDNHQYVAQIEYRHRFLPRWSAAGYALVGEVADVPNNFFSDLKPAVGGGVRFKLTKDQDTLLRFDIGFGKDDNGGIYFGVNEAF